MILSAALTWWHLLILRPAGERLASSGIADNVLISTPSRAEPNQSVFLQPNSGIPQTPGGDPADSRKVGITALEFARTEPL